ncbi:MAG: hypothetical protein KJ950_12875 [Proteobacteria bacterium]|nr:hypothetical protein [Pseudomonadota bacterium]MBU1687146.1 hypothetical protein [Pseudomonadota bacterium]
MIKGKYGVVGKQLAWIWVLLVSLSVVSCSSGGGSGDSGSVIPSGNGTEDSGTAPTVSFTIDSGYRINLASNPRIMDYAGGVLSLGYEYRATELADTPSERGYIAFSSDGLSFAGNRQFLAGESKGKGVLLPDMTYRRYSEDQATGTLVSESSTDGVTYVPDAGARYDLSLHDHGNMGVRTFFVDQDGGVVLLYNNNLQINGNEVIFVKRAYSQPGDNGLNFVLTNEDVIGLAYDDGLPQSFADPNAIVLADGRVRLIVMQQDRDTPMPPLGRTGTLYSFISDDGETFMYETRLFAWRDFTEFEVRSLNDPKIICFEDNTCRIYVAAMVPTESGEEDQGEYKWIIVSAHQNE